jgi:protein-glutamine gamma-glutamyltransferase
VNFEKFFKFISYVAVFCGFLSLWVAGTFGLLGTGLFLTVAIIAWFIEDKRWQLSERVGTALIVFALPVYYLASRFHLFSVSGSGPEIAAMLGRLILTLTAIKLLQKKSDRDWIFLYLMAFFEVLLAAGLSISALYLASFVLYMLVMVCTIIAFEIRKTSRRVAERTAGLIKKGNEDAAENAIPARRLPAMAALLITGIVCLGLPLFFFLPRVGGAGFGGRGTGVSTSTGFSDHVELGQFGTIQQDDAVVMRVKLDGITGEQSGLYWRGLALDHFDGHSWERSDRSQDIYARGERDLIALDRAASRESLITQTVYLEPLDTSILFGLSRIVGVRTNLPAVFRDADGDIRSGSDAVSRRSSERMSYQVISDGSTPSVETLRLDNQRYADSIDRFLELPSSIDSRIGALASQITAGKTSRYDKAKAIEQYLQTNFGYSLEVRGTGSDPLADFLFNVRQGHCEYFATAMAIMLRTQGIAARVVNGFHQGDYNETADIYVVRQKNAHSWVEVYFPKEDAWVRFDPTPPADQVAPGFSSGLTGRFNKWLDALETYWIQYFVAYDNQEQRSLAKTVRSSFTDYQQGISSYLGRLQTAMNEWWAEVRGDHGAARSGAAIGYAALYAAIAIVSLLVFVWVVREVVKLKVWRGIADLLRRRKPHSIVEFYDRMQRILASKGFVRQPHQTPLEFAYTVGMTEAINVTEKYNRVRFGARYLSDAETDEIAKWLDALEGQNAIL